MEILFLWKDIRVLYSIRLCCKINAKELLWQGGSWNEIDISALLKSGFLIANHRTYSIQLE